MRPDVYRFRFATTVSMQAAHESLVLAVFSAEGMYPAAQVRLSFRYVTDEAAHCLMTEAWGEAGQAVTRILVALLLREFGDMGFTVEPVTVGATEGAGESGQRRRHVRHCPLRRIACRWGSKMARGSDELPDPVADKLSRLAEEYEEAGPRWPLTGLPDGHYRARVEGVALYAPSGPGWPRLRWRLQPLDYKPVGHPLVHETEIGPRTLPELAGQLLSCGVILERLSDLGHYLSALLDKEVRVALLTTDGAQHLSFLPPIGEGLEAFPFYLRSLDA